jgi:hypothetical protein
MLHKRVTDGAPIIVGNATKAPMRAGNVSPINNAARTCEQAALAQAFS